MQEDSSKSLLPADIPVVARRFNIRIPGFILDDNIFHIGDYDDVYTEVSPIGNYNDLVTIRIEDFVNIQAFPESTDEYAASEVGKKALEKFKYLKFENKKWFFDDEAFLADSIPLLKTKINKDIIPFKHPDSVLELIKNAKIIQEFYILKSIPATAKEPALEARKIFGMEHGVEFDDFLQSNIYLECQVSADVAEHAIVKARAIREVLDVYERDESGMTSLQKVNQIVKGVNLLKDLDSYILSSQSVIEQAGNSATVQGN